MRFHLQRKQKRRIPCVCGHADSKPHCDATPEQIGPPLICTSTDSAIAEALRNVEEHFGRKINPATIMRWVHFFADRALGNVCDTKIPTEPEWMADEIVVYVGRRKD